MLQRRDYCAHGFNEGGEIKRNRESDVCNFHSRISNEMVLVIRKVLQHETRLIHEKWSGWKVAGSNYFCPTFNELHLHQQTFSTSAFGIMICSYPTEICREKELTFGTGSVTSVKADGLSEMLIRILRYRRVFPRHVCTVRRWINLYWCINLCTKHFHFLEYKYSARAKWGSATQMKACFPL